MLDRQCLPHALYTRYPIVVRAWTGGLQAEYTCEQRYLAYNPAPASQNMLDARRARLYISMRSLAKSNSLKYKISNAYKSATAPEYRFGLPIRTTTPAYRSGLPLRPTAPAYHSDLLLRHTTPTYRSSQPLRPTDLAYNHSVSRARLNGMQRVSRLYFLIRRQKI